VAVCGLAVVVVPSARCDWAYRLLRPASRVLNPGDPPDELPLLTNRGRCVHGAGSLAQSFNA
jgi:hypothetical protein